MCWAGRWARRRAGRRWWWTAARLAGLLLPVALFACYPTTVEFVMPGRTVRWAQMMYFAEGTVKAHLSAILRGLAVQNRVQAAITAYEAGMTE